jgi:hypothetical protein
LDRSERLVPQAREVFCDAFEREVVHSTDRLGPVCLNRLR